MPAPSSRIFQCLLITSAGRSWSLVFNGYGIAQVRLRRRKPLQTCFSHDVLYNFSLESSDSFHNCFQETRITIPFWLIYRKSNVKRDTKTLTVRILDFYFLHFAHLYFLPFQQFLFPFSYFVQLKKEVTDHPCVHTHMHTQRGTTT